MKSINIIVNLSGGADFLRLITLYHHVLNHHGLKLNKVNIQIEVNIVNNNRVIFILHLIEYFC